MKVYLIENKINQKQYVGITKGKIKTRWKQHKKDSKNPKQTIHFAIRKYGQESFTVLEIDEANTIEKLYEKEKRWIKKLNSKNNGYNNTDGGEGTLGIKLSNKRKNILREKANIRWDDPKERLKHSFLMKEYYKQNPITEETKEKQRNRHIRNGWNHTEETKQLMRENSIGKNKGIIRSNSTKQLIRENNINNKTRVFHFLDGDKEEFYSLTEASRILSIPLATLKYLIKNNSKSKKHNIKEIITL